MQDVQYADIDHYDERKVFTIDNVNFAGISDYFEELRNNGMRTIIILVGVGTMRFVTVRILSYTAMQYLPVNICDI